MRGQGVLGSLVRVGILTVIFRFVLKYIIWVFLIGMLPFLVLKDLAEDPQPGLGHAVWMMTGAPACFLIAATILVVWFGKHTKSGAAAFLALFGAGLLGVFACGAFFKGCTSLSEDHVGPLFSDHPPYAEEALELYRAEVRQARSLGYTVSDDPYLSRYYREHPPQHDGDLREPVRHRLEEYRSKGGQ